MALFKHSFLLCIINFLINLVCFYKFVVIADTLNLTVVNNKNFIGVLNRRNTLSNDKYGCIFKIAVKLSRIFASVAVSTALVESSRIRILGFLIIARAMQRRCF